MKHTIYLLFALLLGSIYAGCSQSEIELYNQSPRINFHGAFTIRTLVDTDYVQKPTHLVDSFTVRIQGNLLQEPRDLCVKASPNANFQKTVEVELDNKYTYTAIDTVFQVFYYKIRLPEFQAGNAVYGCYLEFDTENPLHQFDKGLTELSRRTLNVRWELKPTDWQDYYFGSYSDAKYIFIMEACKRVWKDMEYEDIDRVKQAYKAYKEAGNPPILGADGDEMEYE